MEKEIWYKRPFFFIVIILYFLLGYSTLLWGNQWGAILYPEDHYFETVGAISLFVASGLWLAAFVLAYRNRQAIRLGWIKTLVYLGLGLLFFFGAGEEISWGQRIFHIQAPAELVKENTQHELNLHNLAIFQNSKYLEADNLFTVFWIAFTVLLPLAAVMSASFKRFALSFTPIPYLGLGGLQLLNYLSAKLAKVFLSAGYSFTDLTFTQAVQEVKESNYELMFALLALTLLLELLAVLANSRQATSRVEEPQLAVENQATKH